MISLSQRGSFAVLQLQNSFKLCINREWFITDETVQQLKVSNTLSVKFRFIPNDILHKKTARS